MHTSYESLEKEGTVLLVMKGNTAAVNMQGSVSNSIYIPHFASIQHSILKRQ